jgi:predicted secreted hydrolase
LLAAGLILIGALAAAAEVTFPPVTPDYALEFPRDHGAHPEYRTEWWYVTGQVQTDEGHALGFQVTFFRSRTGIGESSRSAFAPSQLVFAHAALSDTRHGRLRHDQKSARVMPGIAAAATGDTDLRLESWSLRRRDGRYRAVIPAGEFRLDLGLAPTRAPLLQGERGVSRKGPEPRYASYYYSLPQLQVSGTIETAGETQRVRGTAWLDHEWSSEALMPGAQGWDWVGLNLDDGGAVMAFRIRDAAGNALWAAATVQDADGGARHYGPGEVSFEPLATWTSPRTHAVYPVSAALRVGAETWNVEATMPDQELDSRASTGAIYWEGAVRVTREGERIGQGYLELTGYTDRIRY